MNPSPQNGERDPRSKSGGFSFLDIVMFAFAIAVLVHVLTIRRARSAEAPVVVTTIMPGTWITTEDGRPVCRLTTYVYRGAPYGHRNLSEGFCIDWQPPFQPMQRGQIWPTGDGWVRWAQPPMTTGNYLQFHTEQGWLP